MIIICYFTFRIGRVQRKLKDVLDHNDLLLKRLEERDEYIGFLQKSLTLGGEMEKRLKQIKDERYKIELRNEIDKMIDGLNKS